MHKPKISIICPSFNHERYVACFINSLLQQTEQDFELIIVDDSSTDNTINEIQNFSDTRIKLLQHEYNKGINQGINTAFAHVSADIVVFIASDDLLHPEHLEKSLAFFKENLNIQILYHALAIMDINGNPLEDAENIYIRENISNKILLNKMFYEGNKLLSPGMCIRKKALEDILPLPLSVLQLQDYKIHIDLLLNNEIFLNTERLVYYRLPSEKSGISVRTEKVIKREELELDILLDSYLKINTIELLKEIFPEETKNLPPLDAALIPFYLGKFALNGPLPARKRWGYQAILRFLTPKTLQLLHEKHSYQYGDIIRLVDSFPVKKPLTKLQKLKKIYKLLFGE